MNPNEIPRYIDIAKRRKWWLIIPFLLSLLVGFAYFLVTPKIYKAETLILVQSQKVPEDFVRPIVTTELEDRLRTITQEVTSRTNLERIVQEHELYLARKNLLLEEKVQIIRQNVSVDVSYGDRRGQEAHAFTISFHHENPIKVMQVTNALSSNFISENLKIRETQVVGTSSFLFDELDATENKLAQKEANLKVYREKYMGGLPEQLETNLRILERLQEQVAELNSSLRDAESRKMMIQTQIADHQERPTAIVSTPTEHGQPETTDLVSLRNQLASLESRYTERHPDVIRLRNIINKLESGDTSVDGGPRPGGTPESELSQNLRRQQQDVILEIDKLKNDIEKTHAQIESYESKVEDTPKREQELLSLKRDYDNLQELYNSLLGRKLEAEIAVSMERKQKGEQFRVIDAAKIPNRPVAPDVKKIILFTFVIGLGLGGGLAFLKENMDSSFKTPDDIEDDLQIPVLVTLPLKLTELERKKIKLKNILAYTATLFGFILSAIGIVIAAKGIDKTMDFVRNLLLGV